MPRVTVGWDYEDDESIDGFAIFVANDPLGFEFLEENIVCEAEPYERQCTLKVNCGHYITCTAYVDNEFSEISNVIQYTCGD